jgi:EAL domain-containing protein (putative c-di-GMP-specific phosphodiesterase class I)
MRMQVVVEGVESLGAAAWLKALGCDVAQGFAIARPMSGAAFSQWLDRECHAIGAALGDTFSDPRVLAIAG